MTPFTPGRGCPDETLNGTPGGGIQLGLQAAKPAVFTGTGAAGSAFAQARSAAADTQRESLLSLRIEIDHLGAGGRP